jgi:hypothetical protein
LFTRKQRHSEALNFTLQVNQVMFLTPCGLHKVKGLKIICSLEERWMGCAASLVQARTPSDHAEANDAYGASLILQLEPQQRGKPWKEWGKSRGWKMKFQL